MAILGAQIVITLVMVSVIQKLAPHFSFARWLLCSNNLVRFLYPTNDELRAAAGIPKDKPKTKKGKDGENGKIVLDTFKIPRNIDIQLEFSKVTPQDVVHLRYYTEYQWLVDFALYTAVVYIITEIYTYFFPLQGEVNLSILWCLLFHSFALKTLFSITTEYFRGSESIGERSTVIVSAFAFLLISMMILIIDESKLDSGLETAYSSFNSSASVFLENQGLPSDGPASKIILKFVIAVWCALIGAFFVFPGLRAAQMHCDALRFYDDRHLIQLLLNLSFVLPGLLLLFWVKPLSSDYLSKRVFSGMTEPLIRLESFESIRLIVVVGVIFHRIMIMPLFLQAYLNLAHRKVEDQKKEVGKMTNVEFQKKIAAVFYYLVVVALQYLIPLLMCLYFAFMYKTLGDYSWLGTHSLNATEHLTPPVSPTASQSEDGDSILQSAHQFSLALNSLKDVLTAEVHRGLFGFATWWSIFALFTSSCLGLIYQSYFVKGY
nr:PREDICTED: transmembrane protein 161B [Bemisia tabaci]